MEGLNAASGGFLLWIVILLVPLVLLKLLMRFIRKTKHEKAKFEVEDMPSPDPEPQPLDQQTDTNPHNKQ